jgi:two-component system invasion response regulator UvrY
VLTIVICDDHPVLRQGTINVVREHLSPVTVEEAENGNKLLALISERTWDVCIMDVSMPGTSGTDLLQQILRVQPSLPVLVFSMHPENMYAVPMIRAGASGYLNKSTTPPALLIEAIKSVVSGQKFLTPMVAECLATAIRANPEPSSAPHELLSNRELQIFEMLVAGKPLRDIARQLDVSSATISTYRTRMLQKLRLKSNADLIRYAIEHSLFG